MKEGWEYMPLGEICDFTSGFTPKKNELNAECGTPYFKVSDMNRMSNILYLTETELYVKEAKKIIPAESIVFPKNGGAIFTGKKRILAQDSIVDLNTEAIKIKNDNTISLPYLYQYLLYIDFGQFDNGGGLPSINIKKMKEHLVPVPPISEQQQIVEYLDAQFERIDALKANAEKQLQAAKDLFQSTLKDLLTPKEGWEEKKFGEVCQYYKQQDKWENIPYIGLEHIEAHTGKLLDTINSNEVESSTFKFKKGDVLYGRLRPYLQKVIIAPFEGCCSTEIFPIKSNEINHVFLKYWLLSDKVTNIMNNSCAGCRMPRANMTKFKDEIISYPIISEQRQIVDSLDCMTNNIQSLQTNYEQTITLCNDLKQALLKKVFG